MLKTETSRNAPLDADVPDEFRDHYRKQTKKTRDAVDKWLAVQPTDPSPPPREIDDETLGFAILTHLRPDERDPFKALMEHSHHNPVTPNEPESLAAARSELLSRAGSALQRLYRLASPPRDPECAAFLVRYRHLHRVLATLAAVNDSEWDVLTSGRFDGFLWSGADDTHPVTGASPNPSRNATPWNVAAGPGPSQPAVSFSRLERSRTNTPIKILGAVAGASVSRDGTPASATAASPIPPPPPVSIDEETEIAVLAEVEREIYLGMEVLEDAFEALHLKAENVRQALRERGAGLSMAGHSRRLAAAAPYSRGAGGGGGGDGGGMPTSASPTDGAGSDFGRGTPYSAGGGGGGDGGWDSMAANVGAGHGGAGSREADALSDVWPDDSASNISSNRVRRPKRRNQRRTPAPVDEGVEED
ncbi:MAG: hypothetical protein M1826_005395 [Phylliscum demangeonii]|nr:MAG: hypothetical protein M1826_005395 [Phylliscum demangeonii]